MPLNPSPSRPRYQLLLTARWGNGNGEVAAHHKNLPGFSLVADGQVRQVAIPSRIRLDGRSGVHVLDAPVGIDHFDSAGAWQGRTVLQASPPNRTLQRITDFAVDLQRNCYLLEKVAPAPDAGASHRSALSKYNARGELLWRRDGDFSRVFADTSSALYLTVASPAHRVEVVDMGDGSRRQTLELPSGLEQKVFVTPSGLVASKLLQADGLQTIAAWRPGGELELHAITGIEASGLVQFAFAADDALNLYASMPASVFDRAGIARIPFEGDPVVHAEFNQIVVGVSDQAIHLSSTKGDLMRITSRLRDGTTRELTLSSAGNAAASDRRQQVLTGVDAAGRFMVHRNEGPGSVGEIALYAPDGRLESVQVPTPELMSGESVMARGTDWVVDADGSIHVPIADSNGLHIVRIRPVPA
ncbi:hypothetical protein [Rhizobacter sp. P5_C2]